ncbi:MAG: hypothetical protein ACFFCQ_16365 [Promethearchaeota archaeon]
MPVISHISRMKVTPYTEVPHAVRGFYVKGSKGSRGQKIGFLVSGIRYIEIEGSSDHGKDKCRINFLEDAIIEVEDRIYSLGKLSQVILFRLDNDTNQPSLVRGRPKFLKHGYEGKLTLITWKEMGTVVVKPLSGTFACDLNQKRKIISARIE